MLTVASMDRSEIPVDNATDTQTAQAAHRKLVKNAYVYHIILASCVAAVLAMTLHLRGINASPDVVGGGLFLLFSWVALPIVFCFCAALVYWWKTRWDERLTFLTALLIVTITDLLFMGEQAVLIALAVVFELLYIGLTVFFRFTLARQEP